MIVFAWDGFPQYAARCIGAFVRQTKEPVVVIGTKPLVPIVGMDELAGCEVVWIDYNDKRSLVELVGETPRLLVVSGWGIDVFCRLRDEARLAGAKTVATCDNNYIFSFVELLKAIRFRILIRNKYDAFFVPGRSGEKLLRFYGVPKRKIFDGLYAADAGLFECGAPLCERRKKMIYVGQLNARKNVIRLAESFSRANVDGEWSLDMYGCGPLEGELKDLVKRNPGCNISVNPFAQPEELAAKYREARVFCLASTKEHWGLVVHEGALSGCVLLLSDRIGAGEDFLKIGVNGFDFNPLSVDSMTGAIRKAMAMDENELAKAYDFNLEVSKNASLEKFVAAVNKISSVE